MPGMFSSMKDKQKYGFKRLRDLCEVKVKGGNVEAALRALKKRTELAGIFKAQKMRQKYPTTKARRRAKNIRSLQRVRRINKLLMRGRK